MTKGEKFCIITNCDKCPFSAPGKLKVCTGFKLGQTLNEGLEIGKEKISLRDYNRIKEVLKVEA